MCFHHILQSMQRTALQNRAQDLLRTFKVVALLGPRQSGKTTPAQQIAAAIPDFPAERNYFDLEDPAHLDRLENPRLALEGLRGLVVIDEIQRRPELFPVLRVLADRTGPPARFLILGSASQDLIRMALDCLRLDQLTLVCPGDAAHELEAKVQVRGLSRIVAEGKS